MQARASSLVRYRFCGRSPNEMPIEESLIYLRAARAMTPATALAIKAP